MLLYSWALALITAQFSDWRYLRLAWLGLALAVVFCPARLSISGTVASNG